MCFLSPTAKRVSVLGWGNEVWGVEGTCPRSQARRSHDLSPHPTLSWGGGDPHSSFYNSSPFHVDHWRALKVNKAHSLLCMSLWGHNGWKLRERQARRPPLRQPVSTCFTCLLILVETMHFFLTGVERGESGYLEIAGIFKSQDNQYWHKIIVGHLCFPLFMYMSWYTWDNLSH